jgi:4-alpha-glucanotransferase
LFPQDILVETIEDALKGLQLNLNGDEQAQPVRLWVQWENGSESEFSLGDTSASQLTSLGYHHLTVITCQRRQTIRWILTPNRCFFPSTGSRLNGINCFLPSLRSQRNWGVGDLTDLVDFSRKLAQSVPLDFVALNPLHAIHNRTPYNTSPYLPLSIFTHNLLYLNVEAVPEFSISRWAQTWVAQPAVQALLHQLRAAELVHYESVAKIKRFAMALLYRQYLRGSRQSLDQYRKQRSTWLLHYCTYMAFDRYFHRRNPDAWHWRQWPEAYQSPTSTESQALASRLERQIDFEAYIQMRLEEQIASAHQQLQHAGIAVGLYQDLALATDRVGADYWAYQPLFAPGVRVGSPPDDFNENGQDWGFPALHPLRHANSGFEYFVESIRCAARHAGAIRLDHVMRLARLYWIPDHMSAKDGAYVRDRFEDLLRLLALESIRGQFLVVGEDLGTVPDYFRRALDQFGILSYRLILFERDGDAFRPPQHYPQQAIASFTTHDLPTFEGWLTGTDLKARIETGQAREEQFDAAKSDRQQAVIKLREVLRLDPQEASSERFFEALCQFLASTPSRMRLLNLEELCQEREQQNLPGTTSEAPNWQHRIPVPLHTLFEQSGFLQRLNIWAQSIRNQEVS